MIGGFTIKTNQRNLSVMASITSMTDIKCVASRIIIERRYRY